MLQQQVSHRVGGLELKRQHAMRGEDAQEHLYSLFHLLRSPKTLIHPSTDPCRNWFALLLVASTLGGDPLDLLLRNPFHLPLQRHERGAGG
jgi:hypothetical protein